MIIVVAESEDTCNDMAGPADYEDVVEQFCWYLVRNSKGVHDVQARGVLTNQKVRPHCQGDVYTSYNGCVYTLSNEGLL